jgi:hypothetical protein
MRGFTIFSNEYPDLKHKEIISITGGFVNV